MSFVTPTDPEYRSVKRIRQGKDRLAPVYDRFVDRFREHYGIPPLAVAVDAFNRPGGKEKTPRLGVVLERSEQYHSFLRRSHGFDSREQHVVARMFVDTVTGVDLRALFGLPRWPPRAYAWPEDLFVYFADFERVAKWEVHDSVTPAELDAFVASLELGEQFWCTQRFSGPPIVFVHTDEQAAAINASGLPDRWADAYFPIAQRHDEFGYLSRGEIAIQVDSKENFDNNYESNWYYYFK